MSTFAALALCPIWAVSAALAVSVVRLGRAAGRGLAALCLFLAFWVTGLILLETPGTAGFAERVLPAGMLLAGGFVHAGADVSGLKRRAIVFVAYALSGAVAVLGAVYPGLFYAPGARAPGPLFVPVGVVASVASLAVVVWLAREALRAHGSERRRRGAVALGAAIGSLGGGGVIGLRVFGLGDVHLAAPLLLVAVLLAAYAVLTRETGRARDVLRQGLAYACITATLSAIGLPLFYFALPHLAPGEGTVFAWLAFVTFFAALPLDPLRMLIVERVGRLLFQKPIGVRDLADEVEKTEARADQAERLAEIGRLTAAVAHEIRNPLGVIAAQAKLLERQGAQPESVAAVRAQVDRAKHFLDDLLRYGKPRPLEHAEVDVRATLEAVVKNAAQTFGDRPPIELLADGDLMVHADRTAFGDVATALVNNAAIAMEGRDGTIRIAVFREDSVIVLRVEDDGPGVPPELEATLFQPFVTGRGRDARHPGTGLGLAIAARWLARHGGTLQHERRSEGGARFEARWPTA